MRPTLAVAEESPLKWTIDKSVLAGLVLLAGLLLGSASLDCWNTSRLDEDARGAAHTREVLDLNGDVLRTLVDAETGMRGFVITGKDEYLQPYEDAAHRLDGLLARLDENTADNPGQQDRVQRLKQMAAVHMRLLREAVALRHRSEKEAQAFVAAGKSKAQMDALRGVAGEIERQEHALLEQRQGQTRRAYVVAQASAWITAALGLVMVGAYYGLLRCSLAARRQAANALQEQQERLRTTLASIGDAVIVTDTRGRVTFINGVAQELTGWNEDEAKGQPLEAVFHILNEQTRKSVENPALRSMKEGVVVGLANHTVLVSKAGAERPIDDSAAPIRDEHGRVLGAVLVFRDVAQRRQVENEARTHREILRLVHSIGKIGHWEWNALTDENKWSPEIEALYGLPPGTFAGTYQAWAKLLHPGDLPRAESDVRQALATGRYFTEFRVIWPDGSVHWLEARASVFKDDGGRPVRIMGVNMDVTERKRQEEALREADRRKDEFLAMLAHELRNPLAPIRNAVHILRLVGPSDPQLHQLRAMIERQVGHMVRMVDDLLDVSRISRGKIELRTERLDLAAAVHAAVETSRPLVEGARHELTVALPPQPLHVVGDLTRLAQILANLLNNAARYTPEGGRIRLTVERQGDEAVVQVRDNGAGIAADLLPRVFDMFMQADRRVERSHGGVGIGLTLVKWLVELHGGTVAAHSDGEGKGSTFVVRLPLERDVPEGRPPSPPEAPERGPARRILVVDDNHDSADSLALLVRLMGHEVQTAYDGPSALEKARAFRPEVVLLDIGMPEMSGHEVARRMRQMPELDGVVLVAQTGWGQDDDRRTSAEAGFDSHLVKPVEPDAVQRLLATIGRGN